MSQSYTFIDLSDLYLDHLNPRLPKSLIERSDKAVIEWMLQDASLIELMAAIGHNGFFPGEPILVVEEEGKYVVVEGNRRLASVKLLNDPYLVEKNRNKISRVISETECRPVEIPCIVFDSRDEINKYLGYRHVTGVKEWSLVAKARYLNSLIEDPIVPDTYRELAKTIGSRSDYVKRLLIAYDMYCEIEKANFFDIHDLNEESLYFNYLMDSINRDHIRSYIGVELERPSPLERLKNEDSYKENFKRLIFWFFDKSSGKVAIKGDSGSLTKLNEILGDESALDHFLETENLNESHERLSISTTSFHQHLAMSRKNIKDAMNMLYVIDRKSDASLDVVNEIEKIASLIKERLSKVSGK